MIQFIVGILFAYLILPLIQCIVSVANIKTQEFSYIVTQRIKKIQSETQQQVEEGSTKIPMGFQTTDAIGFQIQEEDDWEGD